MNLAEPFKQYRAKFEEWHEGVGQGRLWAEASRL